MKYHLMIACLCSLLIGLSAHSARRAGAVTLQSPQPSNQSEGDRTLAPGGLFEREISVGETHSYRIALTAGQYVQAFVQQKGKEILATLLGPDERKLNEYTEPIGENQKREILFIAQSDGYYRLIITTRKKAAAPALYQVGVEVVRPATEQDRTRARATQLVKEARYVYWRVTPISDDEMRNFASKFEEALRLWESLDDQWMVGETLLDLGILNSKAGEYTKAVEFYERSLPLFPQTPDGLASKATALNNLADKYYRLGETRKALEMYIQSLELKKEGRSRAVTLDNIGGVYARLGAYQQALDLHQQALTTFRELGHIRDEAVALNNIAMAWGKIGDWRQALDYILKSLARIRESGDKNQESLGLYNAGNFSLRMGDNRQALEYAKESLVLSRAVKNSRTEADGLTLLCQIYLSQGETEKAMDACDRALPMHQSGKDRESEALTHSALGQIHQRTGAARKAVESYEAALELYRATANTAGEISVLHSLGRIALEGGDLATARVQIERAIEMVESLRVKSASPNLRSTFLAGHQRLYESYVDLLMQMNKQEPGKGYDRIALQISERARARSLLDLLTESRAQIRQGADRHLLERERDLLQRLKDKDSAWMRLKNSGRTKKHAESIAHEINDLTTQLQLVEAQIRSSSPRYAALTRPEPLGAAEIQQALDETTVLLEFALGEKRSWMWAVTRNSLYSCELAPRAEIEPASRKAYELLTARQLKKDTNEDQRLKRIAEADARLQAETAALSRMLLGPIYAQLKHEWKGKRLAVVASEALEYVPFAVLPLPAPERRETEGQGDRETRRQGDEINPQSAIRNPQSAVSSPLIVNHEIVNLPSASALALIRRETAGRNAATKTLAALADPVFETNDPRLATSRKKVTANGMMAFARSAEFSSASSTLPSELARSVRSFHRDGFGRLFFSDEEANFITGYAPKGSTLKATGFEANRRLVASGELGRYRIVHFATHGLINSEHPELSGLVLSLVDENGKPQDGFLRMSEVFNLEIPADLVVLSACQTALGKEIKGEGLVGLTRGFMYAGAERVVASLWQVDDQATSQLMRHFYRGMLKENLRPAAALRAAQIEMSRISRWSSPYYWAGFVIQGEWR
jgi:CHAT domain-containing protein/tetratricopeptide (TPR) repeat protein